jgi:hypothetical protein
MFANDKERASSSQSENLQPWKINAFDPRGGGEVRLLGRYVDNN